MQSNESDKDKYHRNRIRTFDKAMWNRWLKRRNDEADDNVDGHTMHLRRGVDAFRLSLETIEQKARSR